MIKLSSWSFLGETTSGGETYFIYSTEGSLTGIYQAFFGSRSTTSGYVMACFAGLTRTTFFVRLFDLDLEFLLVNDYLL